ncbi:fam-d protein [Plasmodium chabaudi chabaudi]|uniref:Fam-d protein n=1 Tax=Plasmodium chabaudi chabaudi TaxID=31271 RepID=A0A1D3RWB1_PLACU|nr:fam-d protein [Plasmodium chabaudi chabaudi]
MKMMNIILSFFILVIFSNVKAASFQRASSSNPKSIGLISVNQPIVTVTKYSPNYHQILDEINKFLREQSEDIKCAYEGTNYHWVISNFVITINNSSPYLSKSIPKNKTEELQIGSSYFITYINANINHLFSKYMHKYDFESNYDENLNVLANDLKTLIYDPFDKNFKGGLIKYTNEPENKKLRDSAKKTFYELVHNSEIEIEGYFIKVTKDGNYEHLKQNKSLYFNIRLSEKNANFKYELKIPIPSVVKLVNSISGKS